MMISSPEIFILHCMPDPLGQLCVVSSLTIPVVIMHTNRVNHAVCTDNALGFFAGAVLTGVLQPRAQYSFLRTYQFSVDLTCDLLFIFLTS